MPRYQYPDVPQLPGVPQLNRSTAFPPGPPPVLAGALALGRLVLALLQKTQWGIYRDTTNEPPEVDPDGLQVVTITGKPEPVLVPDSFRTFNFNQEWSVTDAPTEEGGFATYNKVNNPFDVVIRMTKGGSRRDRTEFLEKLDALGNSLGLLKLLTPERTYLGMNIVRYNIRRDEARGAYWMSEIDVYFRQIRIVQSEYSSSDSSTQNARAPSAAPMVNGGLKQPVPASVVPGVQ
jgi:hypothetical protein